MTIPYRILEKKRAGRALSAEEIGEVVRGAVDGSWSDAQLAAFLMASAIHELDRAETSALTRAMLESGESWRLSEAVPRVTDKHSTGGVGDKVSLLLAPLLAACGVPVAMLTGRGLGHTGGTADKLESIPGLRLELDRQRCLDLLERCGLALGIATGEIAPADRRLYALRDQTATIDSVPLIAGSILSKKLAAGAAALVLDVKAGDGAFLPELSGARRLANLLVGTARSFGVAASALITDMSQPLGRWVGHAAEVREVLDSLAGGGPADLLELTLALCQEAASLAGRPLARQELLDAVSSGRARESFFLWAEHQGASAGWLADPRLPLAPHEAVLSAPRSGRLARVATRQLGLLVAEAGGGRVQPGVEIDHGVSLHVAARLGQAVTAGDELGRLYLRRPDEALAARVAACFEVADEAVEPELLIDKIVG